MEVWRHRSTEAAAFIGFDREVRREKDDEAAWYEAQTHAWETTQQRAGSFRRATSDATPQTVRSCPDPMGQACALACDLRNTEGLQTTIRRAARRTALQITVNDGLRPPCGRRVYNVDTMGTVLGLKFMVQGRTGLPAHSFWLQTASGTELTEGLALQDRLADQGVHTGATLRVTRGAGDETLTDENCRHSWLAALHRPGIRGGRIDARTWAETRGIRGLPPRYLDEERHCAPDYHLLGAHMAFPPPPNLIHLAQHLAAPLAVDDAAPATTEAGDAAAGGAAGC
jgi:hypothetical protein